MSRVKDPLRIIRWEVVMGNGRSLPGAIALVVVVSSVAHAQPYADRHVELGAGLGTVASWWTSPVKGGDVRVTIPLAARGDLELLGALGSSPDRSASAVGFYGGQFRLHLRGGATQSVRPFLTFGAIGLIVHSHYDTEVTPPVIGLAGVGVERRLLPRLTVRAEAQSVVLLVIPVGVRVAASASIPIGSPKR
jgi:hypothetical protein